MCRRRCLSDTAEYHRRCPKIFPRLIISHFETVLEKQLRPLLTQAIDRWAVEIKGEPREPIIRDYDKLAEHLTHLFELRHILCHELPSKPLYEDKEVDEFLECAIQFTKALQEVLTFEQYGLTPLTQTDMNIQARERLLKTEEQMSATSCSFVRM
jgi:hypothetical protein